MPRAVVTGLGCITGAGSSVSEAMAGMYSGRRNHGPLSLFPAAVNRPSSVFEVKSENPLFQQCASRSLAFAIIALEEAIAQAGLEPSFTRKHKVATAVGTTVGCLFPDQTFYPAFKRDQLPSSRAIEEFLASNPALALAHRYGCSPLAVTVGNACASGTDAIGLAKLLIEQEVCDMVLAGGTDELCRTTYIGFSSLLLTCPDGCRPFDKNRKGLNLGEGAGMMIIESDVSARKRGADVLAEIAGYGCSSDAYHPTAPHPEGMGIKRAMRAALEESGATPDEIAFINAHGTSTLENDPVEGSSIAEILGTSVPVVSTKSFTGHTLGAAGAVEAVFTVRGLLDGQVPATVGFETPDPSCKIQPTQSVTPTSGKYAMSNSLAFGGQNSVLLFRAI